MSDALKVALLGCGTVGGAVLRLLTDQSDDLAARVGRRIEVAGVAVRRPDRHPEVPADLLTTDGHALVTRTDVLRVFQPEARAIDAIREWDAKLGDDAIWVACSHGDVIKSILADALGLHLDQFQRIVVDPCSVSIVRYTATRPYVLRSNDVGSSLEAFVPPKRKPRARSKATKMAAG